MTLMKIMRYILGSILFWMAMIGCNDNDNNLANPSILQVQIDQLVQDAGIPGAGGALIYKSETSMYINGLRKSGGTESIEINDFFHLGSLTKAMTATMIGKLVEEGLLQWGTKPGEVISELNESIHPGYTDSTLLDFLRHRAGAPGDDDFTDIPTFSGSLSEQRLEATKTILNNAPVVAKGSYRYSNAGYVVAATMAERVSGKSYQELMERYLFEPLNLQGIFGWPTSVSEHQPWGHTNVDGIIESYQSFAELDALKYAEPAGDISMNLTDLVTYMKFHMDSMNNKPTPVSEEPLDQLYQVHTPKDDNTYACGWSVFEGDLGNLYVHTGSNSFFYSVLYILPSIDLACILLINSGGDREGLLAQVATETIIENYLLKESRCFIIHWIGRLIP